MYKKILEQHVPIKYFPLRFGENKRKPRLITFCDAGYSSLLEAASVERCVILYAVPVQRNGPIECSGNAVTFIRVKSHASAVLPRTRKGWRWQMLILRYTLNVLLVRYFTNMTFILAPIS